MGIFDTHAHYLREDFGEELDGLLAELPSMGVERVLAVGCDLESSLEEIALAERYRYQSGGRYPPRARRGASRRLGEAAGGNARQRKCLRTGGDRA